MKNRKINEKDKVLVFGITLLSLIIITGIGFAYFSSTLSNTNNEKLSTETATIALEFDDNDNGVGGTLNLGEAITKKFTLENTGTKDAYAKINWVDLINTYTSQSLSYILEQSPSENGTYTKIAANTVPRSTALTTKELKNNILVPVNTKYYYKLTITLNNLDINQNDDINAEFHSKFNIEEGNSKKFATDTIKDLVLNGNASSTNEITAENVSNSCTNTLAYDGTNDNNLRYTGANPCNYVSFNDELWRVIGVMNNVDDGTGNLETRIKLVRKDSLGEYSWDTSDSSINSGYGINDWTQADLMQELNGDYLNTTLTENTLWYNGRNNQKTGTYDYTKKLTASAQNIVDSVKWYLGGLNYDLSITTELGLSLNFYSNERDLNTWSSVNSQTCNDGYCPRATSWVGKVALIYPSDFGLAVGNDIRNECLKLKLSNYNNNCYINSWISNKGWTLTPRTDMAYPAFFVDIDKLGSSTAKTEHYVYPSLYLKSNVVITGGNGSIDNPFTLGL